MLKKEYLAVVEMFEYEIGNSGVIHILIPFA
jgi:hypothetical protein